MSAQGVDLERPPPRLHLSLEACALRVPPPAALARSVATARDLGFALSLVAPVAYLAAWEGLWAALDAAAALVPGLALVANDWGLVDAAAARWPGPLATGRIFQRSKRRVHLPPAPEGPGPAQEAGFAHPYLFAPWYRAWLAQRGVTALGCDVLPSLPGEAAWPGERLELYFPWTYLSGTRACPFAGEAGASLPVEACGQRCRGRQRRLQLPWPHPPIVRTGAALFLDCSEALAGFFAACRPAPSLLVFQPRVPR